jgi:hypothetical protein
MLTDLVQATACTCTNKGPQPTLPTADDTPGFGTIGYPVANETPEYEGLCSFNCYYGYCPYVSPLSFTHELCIFITSILETLRRRYTFFPHLDAS